MIQVINRALDILEYVASTPESPKSLSNIANHLHLNAGTCANIIKTLVERKYLEKIDRKEGYHIGINSYMLTKNNNYTSPLISAAKHEIELLSKKINENCLCAILRNGYRIALIQTKSDQLLQANTPSEKHAYDSASGRLLVAMLSDKELDNYIQLYGPSGKEFWIGSENKATLLKEINHIRRCKYAIQLTSRQIVGIAIPIYNLGQVIASLSIYLPAARFNKERKAELLKSMRLTEKKIEKNLSK